MKSGPHSSIDCPLPKDIHFDIPRDYAMACGGTIVAVFDNAAPADNLRITWDEEWINFEHGRTVVRYRASRLKRLLMNYSETVLGQSLCTLRALFTGISSDFESLCVLTSGAASSHAMHQVMNSLREFNLPFQIQEIDDTTKIQ